MNRNPNESLFDKLRRLRLSAFVVYCENLEKKDPKKLPELVGWLEKLTDEELNQRDERTVARRIKDADFVQIQTVDAFDFEYNQSTKKIKSTYLQLLQADHVQQGVGAVFVGNSGLGKTHLARSLGYAACQRGYSVMFTPCASLLNRLVAAEATRTLERAAKKFVAPALLIIDELAYLTMSTEEANLFFQVISRRHDTHRTTVVTTNKPFAEWNQVFHGDATAHAIVDRLTEKANIFYLEGKSYRQTHRKGIKPEKDDGSGQSEG